MNLLYMAQKLKAVRLRKIFHSLDLTYKFISLLCLFLSLIALILAYYAEHLLFLAPCQLCLYERIPFFIILISSPFLIFVKRVRFHFALVILFAFFTNMLLSFFHFGVEQEVFKYESVCTGYAKKPSSTEDLINILKDASIGNCLIPSIKVFGLSLSAWNGLFCFTMLVSLITILMFAYANKIQKRIY